MCVFTFSKVYQLFIYYNNLFQPVQANGAQCMTHVECEWLSGNSNLEWKLPIFPI